MPAPEKVKPQFMSGTPPLPADAPEVVARVHEAMPLVDVVARHIHRQFSAILDRDELSSHGRESLLSAARTFDASPGIPFRAWAHLRIRGGMLDALRSHGRLPRGVYQKLRALRAADAGFDSALEERSAAAPSSSE